MQESNAVEAVKWTVFSSGKLKKIPSLLGPTINTTYNQIDKSTSSSELPVSVVWTLRSSKSLHLANLLHLFIYLVLEVFVKNMFGQSLHYSFKINNKKETVDLWREIDCSVMEFDGCDVMERCCFLGSPAV